MSPDLIEIGYSGIGLALVAAWRALLLLAIVLLVDIALRRRLAAKYHAMLWTLVVVRLLLPLSAPSPWSLQGPVDRVAQRLLNASADDARLRHGAYAAEAAQTQIGGMLPQPLPIAATAHQPPPAGMDWGELLATTLIGVWVVVAVGGIARMVIAHLRFASRLRNCCELDSAELNDVLLRECAALRIVRQPRIKEVPELSSPAVFGLLRHTICLPSGALESLSAEELRWVLRHELAHVRRRDMWLLSLASIMRSVHWFNPLAWLMAAKLRSHMEAAADALALDRSSKTDAVAYGRLLVRLAEQATGTNAAPAVGMLQIVSGRSLRGRVEMLMQDRPSHGKWMRALTGMALLALAAASLTDASEPAQPESFPAEWVSSRRHAELNVRIGDARQGPKSFGDDEKSVRSYDVAEVLEKIRQSDWKGEPEELLLNYCPGTLPVEAMRIEGTNLIANLTRREHQELGDLLDAWRQGGPRQVSLEMRVLHVETGLAASLDWNPAKVDKFEQRSSRPAVATTISDQEMRRFMRAIGADVGSTALMAPKVTVFNGQTAALEMLTQRPFVTSVQPQKNGALAPVVQVLDDGLKIGLRPVVSEDQIALRLDLNVSKIDEVAVANLPFRNPKGADGPIRVQVPEVSTTAVHAQTRLAEGETLLIAAPEPFDSQREETPKTTVVYAFTPRLLDEPK